MLVQLTHNGVVVPEPPEPQGLCLGLRGEKRRLTAKQEEMAMAWARKKDTAYVQDPVFVSNFMLDFSAELGFDEPLELGDVDFGEFCDAVDRERAAKEALTREERKAAAAERKAVREQLKAKYGHAIVNGQLVDLGTYMVEPSGIFMGRGEHPLRGRWKQGAAQNEITLNYGPDEPHIDGNWAEIVWQPDSMWVARWNDKLSDKLKYIWLADTAPVKQAREAEKFDKAVELDDSVEVVRAHIEQALLSDEARQRMIATACYLIDRLCLRVGDEKEADEADTVGATTLRPEHVSLLDGGVVEFKFLGKDSVEWHKTLEPPEVVLDNLRELIANARPSSSAGDGDADHPTRSLPQLFPDVSSHDVNQFLSRAMPGLSAKVFRTFHATKVVRESLGQAGIKARDPEYVKWEAANLANFQAAQLCNHTKQYNGDWNKTKDRYAERRAKAELRVDKYKAQLKDYRSALAALRREAKAKIAAAKTTESQQRTRARYRKREETAKRRVETAKQRRQRAEDALGKIKAQYDIAGKKRTWNLGTSLKSYIDPRVYYRWGKKVDYDVLQRYYPTTLRRKFAWVREMDTEIADMRTEAGRVTVRTCLKPDLADVSAFLTRVRQEASDAPVEPVTEESVAYLYLPALERDWREAIVALNRKDQVVAFASIGPEWREENKIVSLDIYAALDPEQSGPKLAQRLAVEIERRASAYAVHQPRKEFVLCPQDEEWVEQFPELADALGFNDEDEGDQDED